MSLDTWRLIWSEEANNCFFNMALDKAVMELVSKKEVPNTIRLYRWKPSAVSIGYFQSMKNVVNIENCEKLGIDYIRRTTGGGAVYHDYEGELTYSINCLNSDPTLPQEITKIYDIICNGIVIGLEQLGIETEFKPINDIIAKKSGKKVSGNALTRKMDVILQHGTILRKVDVEKMFSILVVPDEKVKSKLISSAKERVTSLEIELGYLPSFEEIRNALIYGFEKKLKIKLVKEELTTKEFELAKKYAEEHFKNKNWNFKR